MKQPTRSNGWLLPKIRPTPSAPRSSIRSSQLHASCCMFRLHVQKLFRARVPAPVGVAGSISSGHISLERRLQLCSHPIAIAGRIIAADECVGGWRRQRQVRLSTETDGAVLDARLPPSPGQCRTAYVNATIQGAEPAFRNDFHTLPGRSIEYRQNVL